MKPITDQSWVVWRYQVEHIGSGLVLSVGSGEDEWSAELYDAEDFTEEEALAHRLRLGARTHRLVPFADLNKTNA